MGARLLIFDKLSARHAYSMGHDYLIGKSTVLHRTKLHTYLSSEMLMRKSTHLTQKIAHFIADTLIGRALIFLCQM